MLMAAVEQSVAVDEMISERETQALFDAGALWWAVLASNERGPWMIGIAQVR